MSDTLVFGSNGMAGSAFCRHYDQRNKKYWSVARSQADVNIDCTDSERVVQTLDKLKPKTIINCVADIDITHCEIAPKKTWKINVSFVEVLAKWAGANGAQLIHISTDQFYDYGEQRAHSEIEPVEVLNNYSKQKLAAELVAAAHCNALIIRTSITGYAVKSSKQTFFEWALDVVCHGKQATLFSDAYTSTIDIHSFTKHVDQLQAAQCTGIYNVGCSEVYSKLDFVKELSGQLNLNYTNYSIGSVNALTPRRPRCLGLNVQKSEQILKTKLPDLSAVVRNLLKSKMNEVI